ncbi:isoprenylcysteine carboxyl methyltransferase family protein [Halobacillus sp. Marseille-P3879]|uniref:isoprenylcysteine carboxyl methyltransferase family protein n=1 Tax=Halobacillus sp. Marseille-P3879 TaxID=2045014 RepID=UPI000C7B9B33|nr:isoprenylcysteine carboxylmethyltransferase family protein [Halobacillus sp. Marseille-P3879]
MLLYFFIIFQRLTELIIAKQNKKWMLHRGGIEIESRHYPLFIWLHSLFFLSLFVEWYVIKDGQLWFSPYLIGIFIMLQFLRVWSILSLGRRWNTRIVVIPGDSRISRGPYRYIKHPNYIIVFFELLVIPLLFQAFVTALLFPLLHLLVLTVRLPAEERALSGELLDR